MAQSHAIPAAVQAVMAGDATRFGDVVRAFDGLVRRVVRRGCRDVHAREDVVQEVWLRVYRQVATLLDVRRADAWVARVAKNCVVDHQRRLRRASVLSPLDEDAVELVQVGDSAGWLWELVDTLPLADRQLLVWRYRDAVSYQDIATRLSVPHSTVRGRLYAARQALRKLLLIRNKNNS